MSEPICYTEIGSGRERVSRCCLENCPTHLEHLSQWRYRKVVAFRYLFKTTALQKLLLCELLGVADQAVHDAIMAHFSRQVYASCTPHIALQNSPSVALILILNVSLTKSDDHLFVFVDLSRRLCNLIVSIAMIHDNIIFVNRDTVDNRIQR